MSEETTKSLQTAKDGMNTVLNFFDKELQKVRAGKASPQMLEGLKVDYYGNPTPIEQVGNISTLLRQSYAHRAGRQYQHAGRTPNCDSALGKKHTPRD